VTPQGSGDTVPFWNIAAGSDDVRWIGALFDDVERTTCIDAARVYVTGMSNGALMTSRIACEYADRIAAVAPVAGITDPPGCRPSRPVPVIAFHGTDDRFLPYNGGLGTGTADLPLPDGSGARIGDRLRELRGDVPAFASVPDSLAAWARRNACTGRPAETKVADDVTLVSYACPRGAEVSLYRVEGGGHAWPGSAVSAGVATIVGRTTTSISANDLMWAFFRTHTR
jgi:polyhydroxybutyrate depolymerase